MTFFIYNLEENGGGINYVKKISLNLFTALILLNLIILLNLSSESLKI